MGVRPWWGRNPCLLLSRCPKFGKRLREQFYRSAFCRFPMYGPHREPIPKCSLPPNLAGVWSDLGANSGQVSFERTEALACWELALAPSGLAYPLIPTAGIVRGTRRASRGGSTKGLRPGHIPTGGCTRAQFQWQARPTPVSPTGSPAAKRASLAEGASQIRSNDALTGAHCAAADGAFGNLLDMTEDTAVIEL